MKVLRCSHFARHLPAAALLLIFAAPAFAQSAAEEARVVSLMQADNYNFATTGTPSVWSIHATGRNLRNMKVVVAVGDDPDPLVVMFVTVAEKRRLPVTTGFMRMLLRENNEFDRVKVGYDPDGDLFVRADAKLRILDAEELKENVEQLEKASDELYGKIKAQLKP